MLPGSRSSFSEPGVQHFRFRRLSDHLSSLILFLDHQAHMRQDFQSSSTLTAIQWVCDVVLVGSLPYWTALEADEARTTASPYAFEATGPLPTIYANSIAHRNYDLQFKDATH